MPGPAPTPGVQPPDAFMRRALELAERGRGTTSPNPMVGCVLVRDGVIVGEGWHHFPGGPHAEIVALNAAGEHAQGATAYVTLEPCAHSGRTGPCTEALVAAGIASIEIAVPDPNPVAAGGSAALNAAGIPTVTGRCASEAAALNEVFFHVVRQDRPFVMVKAATSLDGRIAAMDGTSQWLTGAATRARVHRQRGAVDAVVVGSGTILADDAWLTARPDGALARRQPLRVVLDGRGRTPASARIFDASAATLVITTAHGAEQLPDGVEFAVVRPGKGGPRPDGAGGAPRGERNSIETLGVNLDDVFEVLLRRGIHSVLVEGGAAVATAIIDHGICDRLELHLAPLLLGDSATALYTGGPSTLEQAERFVLETVERIDNDIIVALRPGRG